MQNLAEKSVELGAYKAHVINTDEIVFDKELRKFCEANLCGNFGRNHMCPPSVGDADELIEKAKTYKQALIFQTVSELEDSYDFEGMMDAAKNHQELAGRIRGLLTPGTFLELTAGGCNVCEKCAKREDKPCRFPDKAISSLEAYCINVSTLASSCGMNYINGTDTVTYFGGFFF